MSDLADDETPESTLMAVLLHSEPAIQGWVKDHPDWADYLAFITSDKDTPNVRVFRLRFVERERYAKEIQAIRPDISLEILQPRGTKHICAVVMFDGWITVRSIPVEADEHATSRLN